MTAKRKPKPNPADRAFRDHVAVEVCRICVGDLSRQLSGGTMPKLDAPAAIEFVTLFSYAVADAMIAARDRK